MISKKALTGESITSILFWIIFFLLALGAIYFLVKKFG